MNRLIQFFDDSNFDVPRLVREIQFDLDKYIMFANLTGSLNPANKSGNVGSELLNHQNTLSVDEVQPIKQQNTGELK
ncbi:hypothetical protein [Legionella bononiensis]|uniref:Uncharacterized protein n=1 Tax=Legionella bononiensis TaxID=2793102 RepID=A0ABS1W846_9GAMM|nr:hypothetical protein [Legionella bononiensis]MBL7479947.1 hypothetical protein [Legionella bononiensis]MBL7525538.1 hypothetical protein [Legionella bononiensis]MBL7561722.1 hypothetical protein [Legionella bononiensis]